MDDRLPFTPSSARVLISSGFVGREEVRYLASVPQVMSVLFKHEVEPQSLLALAFRALVAEMYRDYGWEVELTGSTRDGGYDLIALKQCAPHEFRILVEVKRYNPGRAVGVGIIPSVASRSFQLSDRNLFLSSPNPLDKRRIGMSFAVFIRRLCGHKPKGANPCQSLRVTPATAGRPPRYSNSGNWLRGTRRLV